MKLYLRQGRPVERLRGVQHCETPEIQRQVFGCGLHRSGTSLLEQLLVSTLEVCCLRVSVNENEGQLAQDVSSPAYKFGGPGRFAFSPEMDRELSALRDFPEAKGRSFLVTNCPTSQMAVVGQPGAISPQGKFKLRYRL